MIRSNKIWYIEIQGQKEGPFSFDDLKRDSRITPDTRVRKKGSDSWRLIRDVPELAALFKDDVPSKKEESAGFKCKPIGDDELALDYSQGPPNLFWILMALIVLTYVISRLYLK